MSEKSYLVNHEPIKSYTDLNYVHLNSHEHVWKNIIDTHPFNQAVRNTRTEKNAIKTQLLNDFFFFFFFFFFFRNS
jgi:hypothetical protein